MRKHSNKNSSYNAEKAERKVTDMKAKPIIFALIAAAVSGIAGDMTEKGLIALDERRQRKKAEAEGETETEDSDEAEEEEGS